LSIISGVLALLTTIIISVFTCFISVARLDVQKIPIPAIALLLEPSFVAFCGALMVDHDNTNPIKCMALEWFGDRLQSLRRAEVH